MHSANSSMFQMKGRTGRQDQCKRVWKNTTQGMFLIVCLGWFFLKMYQSYTELIAEHVGTQVELVSNIEVDPPAITICRPSTLTYSEKTLKDHGLHVGKEETIEGMELIENLNKAMRNVLQSALITHDDLTNGLALFDEVAFINYGYYGDGEIRINSSLTIENSPFAYWHPIVHPYYGQCQSLILKKDILANLRSSLSLIQIHFSQESKETSIPSWLIFLHTPNAFGYQMEVLRIFAGRLYDFDIKPKIVNHVTTINKPCNTELGYKMEDCLFQCLEVEYIKKYGCRNPKIAITGNTSQEGVHDCTSKDYRKIYPDLASDEMVLGLSELVAQIQIEDYQRNICKCLPPCTMHSVTSGVNKDGNLFESLDIGASTVYLKMPNTVHIYSEYVTYSELQFTSDLGGFLGLFMGLSLYSLHDFMNIVIDWGIDVISA